MPSEAVPLEGLTDEDLFNDANSDEAPVEPAAETPEAPVEQDEQPRDEAGRFAEKLADEPVKPVVDAVAEKPAVDDSAAMVPSWRVREINEEKRALADRLATMEAERQNWQRQQPPKAPLPEAERPTRPDPLLDPEGYANAIRQELREERLNERREESMQSAHGKYKEEFIEAFKAAEAHVDPALKARMQQSRDPGETLVQWHREQKTMREVGTDPNAFFEKKLDAWLADPANQAKVIERARGSAQQQLQPGRQAPAVDIPQSLISPSLTRATNASREVSADDDDLSNDGLWRHANA